MLPFHATAAHVAENIAVAVSVHLIPSGDVKMALV